MLTDRRPFDRSRFIKQSGVGQESRRVAGRTRLSDSNKQDFKTRVPKFDQKMKQHPVFPSSSKFCTAILDLIVYVLILTGTLTGLRLTLVSPLHYQFQIAQCVNSIEERYLACITLTYPGHKYRTYKRVTIVPA